MYKRPHFFSFSGRMTTGEFWSSFFTSLFGSFCMLMVLCILLCILVPSDDVAVLERIMDWTTFANSLFWLTHIAALTRRRLRDAGFTAKSYLWLLLPVVGWLIFIVKRLCARSVENM